jgi:Na+-driven multidrug efflux pump
MISSEFWMFELLTLMASHFGPIAIAAQSIAFQSIMISTFIFVGNVSYMICVFKDH